MVCRRLSGTIYVCAIAVFGSFPFSLLQVHKVDSMVAYREAEDWEL